MAKPPNPDLVRTILAIALDELGSKPPDKVSMRAIAERAGVSATVIYYYFDSKQALFNRIKFDAMDALDAEVTAATTDAQGARARLSALIRAVVRWCLEHPHLARLLMEELPPEEDLDEGRMARFYATFFRARSLLEEAIAEGSIGPRDSILDVSVAQAALWGLVVQFSSKRVHPRFWDSIDPLVDRFIELFEGRQEIK